MKITKVSYSALANLGNYQNERIGMTAVLDDGESPEAAVEELRKRVTPLCNENLDKLQHQIWNYKDQIQDIERKLRDYELRWNEAAEFLRAQGIKPDAPNFPQFTNLLPAVSETVVEGEFEEEEEEE